MKTLHMLFCLANLDLTFPVFFMCLCYNQSLVRNISQWTNRDVNLDQSWIHGWGSLEHLMCLTRKLNTVQLRSPPTVLKDTRRGGGGGCNIPLRQCTSSVQALRGFNLSSVCWEGPLLFNILSVLVLSKRYNGRTEKKLTVNYRLIV
jgi:hypothetical protein